MKSLRAILLSSAVLSTAYGCEHEQQQPDLTKLRLPSGMLLSPDDRWLFVSNSNLDRKESSSSLVAVDLHQVFTAMQTNSESCTESALHSPIMSCNVQDFIKKEYSRLLPSGAGNIALDFPAGTEGPWRLLIPSRIERTITWIDVYPLAGEEIKLECEQDESATCGGKHILTHLENQDEDIRLPRDPARLVIDQQGFRFAYLPHLLTSHLTLLALNEDVGPRIVDIADEFYRSDPLQSNSERAGGFSVAQRSCQPERAPSLSEECTKPFLYTSQRFWPGLRHFSVRTGTKTLQGGSHRLIIGNNLQVVDDRPFVGDLQFVDPNTSDELLVVQTTPPALVRIDTSLNEDGIPRDQVIGSIALCRNPNLLAISRPLQEEWIAFVSCYADDEIVAVSLGGFVKIASIPVGDGPNEMVVDESRRKLYVVNTLENSLAIVELSRQSPQFLQVIAYLM